MTQKEFIKLANRVIDDLWLIEDKLQYKCRPVSNAAAYLQKVVENTKNDMTKPVSRGK